MNKPYFFSLSTIFLVIQKKIKYFFISAIIGIVFSTLYYLAFVPSQHTISGDIIIDYPISNQIFYSFEALVNSEEVVQDVIEQLSLSDNAENYTNLTKESLQNRISAITNTPSPVMVVSLNSNGNEYEIMLFNQILDSVVKVGNTRYAVFVGKLMILNYARSIQTFRPSIIQYQMAGLFLSIGVTLIYILVKAYSCEKITIPYVISKFDEGFPVIFIDPKRMEKPIILNSFNQNSIFVEGKSVITIIDSFSSFGSSQMKKYFGIQLGKVMDISISTTLSLKDDNNDDLKIVYIDSMNLYWDAENFEESLNKHVALFFDGLLTARSIKKHQEGFHDFIKTAKNKGYRIIINISQPIFKLLLEGTDGDCDAIFLVAYLEQTNTRGFDDMLNTLYEFGKEPVSVFIGGTRKHHIKMKEKD